MRAIHLLTVVFLAGGMACGDIIGPGDDSGALPALPQRQHYKLVPVDTADYFLLTQGGFAEDAIAGLTSTGEVFGVINKDGQSGIGRFRWSNGKFTVNAVKAPIHVTAANSRGDFVGDAGTLRPIVWFAEDAAPIRLFAFDTAVVAIGINDRREVLLAPGKEFSPGASVWANGSIKPVSGGPLTPSFITDSGLVWVRSRGSLIDTSWFAPSPVRSTSPFQMACPSTPARTFVDGDRRTLRLLSYVTFRDTTHYYVDDGKSCRNISRSVRSFRPARLVEGGYLTGVVPDAYAGAFAISNGESAVVVRDLVPEPLVEWGLDFLLTINDSGVMLFSGRKAAGYGKNKLGLVLLVPQ